MHPSVSEQSVYSLNWAVWKLIVHQGGAIVACKVPLRERSFNPASVT